MSHILHCVFNLARRGYNTKKTVKGRNSINNYVKVQTPNIKKKKKRIIPDEIRKLEPNYQETNVESVFTSISLEPIVELPLYSGAASSLFNLPAKYLSPKDLNYNLPTNNVSEIAFIGRSNVGKSSLISTLLSEKTTVKISKEPGCTKTINFYCFLKSGVAITSKDSNESNKSFSNQNSHRLYLVDLPGYGFAKVSADEQKKWNKVIKDYIFERPPAILRRIFLLVDSRHGLKGTVDYNLIIALLLLIIKLNLFLKNLENDVEMMDLMNDSRVPYQIILTKADLVNNTELDYALKSIFHIIMGRGNCTCYPFVHLASSRAYIGLEAIQQAIAEVDSQEWGQIYNKNNDFTPSNASLDKSATDEELANNIKRKIPTGILKEFENGTGENVDELINILNKK